MTTALVTGGSRGLGKALSAGLVRQGWTVVIDGRHADELEATAHELSGPAARTGSGTGSGAVIAVPGDVTDPNHRRELIEAAAGSGGLELVVNNASSLGTSPLPPLRTYPLESLRDVLDTNLVAPLALVQAAAPLLDVASQPRVINVTSDASVEAYEGWGGYGSSKAGLDHLGAILAVENPGWRVWTVDPGDLRTQMHQDAFPGEDISDRPEPESVVPAFLALIGSGHQSGRVRLSELGVVVSESAS